MSQLRILAWLDLIQARISSIEKSLSSRSNMIIFLVIRFVLMSGMVVGFTWWSLNPIL